MLLNQGGMCGVWYQAFQQMAHCQGVFVYRRRFMVDWRHMPDGEEHWCAIVIRTGGLNQAGPTTSCQRLPRQRHQVPNSGWSVSADSQPNGV